MIDFHTHCLPEMDDGAANAEESLQMLRQSAEQGIHLLVATPHFYRDDESVGAFLQRRRQACQRLQARLETEPHLVEQVRLAFGAEIYLQEGISAIDLRPLCIGGTDTVLLELPYREQPPWLIEELENIALGQRLKVMLAHVDRYMPFYSRSGIRRVMDFPGMIAQINAGSLMDGLTFRRLRRWLPSDCGVVFGSDMHHAALRPPNLGIACQRLRRRRVGRAWIKAAEQCGGVLFSM